MTRDTNRNASPTSSKDHHMHGTTLARRPRIARSRRLARALANLAVACVGVLGFAAAPALAGECPNEQLRIENNSTRLPECRAYELVTPNYKEGFAPDPPFHFIDGVVAYHSTGNFEGDGLGSAANDYVATRSATGWLTESPNPSGPTYADQTRDAEALSADLRSSVWALRLPNESSDLTFYYLRGPDGTFTRIGPGVNPATAPPGSPGVGGSEALMITVAASADLSHVLFTLDAPAVFPGIIPGVVMNLYEYVGTANERPQYVAVDNAGNQLVPAAESCSNGLSIDGRVVIFTTGCNGGLPHLWARINETTTIDASASECTRTSEDPGGDCNAVSEAVYTGAARDGSRVFFITSQQLVNGDTNQTNDLYACDIPPGTPTPVGLLNSCASLTEVSAANANANVEGVDSVSADGSRVYFTATGVLAANTDALGEPAKSGDENLYVWERDASHPAGQTTFVAKQSANDHCIWGVGFACAPSKAQSTADGRYLLLPTTSPLLASDTDETQDIYRYDADTHALLRLSTDTSGGGGNAPGLDATLNDNAMTDDGSTVVFLTDEALSPADTNGTTDVYEWHEGQVSLISSGRPEFGSFPISAGVSPSGTDIYFTTTTQVSAIDDDTGADIYDARIGGGFSVAQTPQCSGEACQGASTPPPSMPDAAASATFNGPGNPASAQTPLANAKPKPQTRAQKLAKALKACRSKHDRKKRAACEKRARRTYGRTR